MSSVKWNILYWLSDFILTITYMIQTSKPKQVSENQVSFGMISLSQYQLYL